MSFRVAFGSVLLLAVTLTASPARAAEGEILGAGASTAIPGRYIVVLKSSLDGGGVAERASGLAKRYGGTVGRVYSESLSGFSVGLTEAEAQRLAADPAVAHVEQDQRVRLAETQESPVNWGLDRIDQRDLPFDRMYNFDVGGNTVNAYVIDTGIRTTHVEFGGRARDGWDFVNNDNVAEDCHGHGTHVAATVGGRDYGVAKDVRLVAVRAFGCDSATTGERLLAAVEWVTANAVRPAVVNLSISSQCVNEAGDPEDCPIDTTAAILFAIKASIDSGISWVIAAGNQAIDACRVPFPQINGVVTVGGTTLTDAKVPQSNWGACVDLFAPGDLIISAGKDNDTAIDIKSGTSFATPFVTGAVARIYAKPGWANRSPAEVRNELLTNWSTTGRLTDLGAGSPNRLLYTNPPLAVGGPAIAAARNGNGRVDVYGIGPDGSLNTRSQTTPNVDTWTGWTAATTTGWYAVGAQNHRDTTIGLVGVRRPDGDLWHRTKLATAGNTNAWTAWSQLDGKLNAVSVANMADGKVEFFATNAQGQALHRSQVTTGGRTFTPWEQFGIGGSVLRGITAETNGNGLIEVFTTTNAGQIWHRWQTAPGATTYTPWVQLDGTMRTVAPARHNDNGQLILFGVNSGGQVFRKAATSGTNTWQNWFEIPRSANVGTLTSLAAETYADGRVALFGVNNRGQAWYTHQTAPRADTYTTWTQLDGFLRP